MISNFKAPNLNAPRYREKVLGLLNIDLINEFKDKYPIYLNIDKDKLKSIIKLYNKKLWEEVINNRSGVELPDSLGYLFIGTCPTAKSVNTNYALSKQNLYARWLMVFAFPNTLPKTLSLPLRS